MFVVLLFIQFGTVVADVPDVLQIQNISQGSAGRIRLEIRHASPSSSHYVDTVEVEIEGQVKHFDLQPQSNNPFTVELDLGDIQGTPGVRARAHCNLHGWSAWSNQITVPEFPAIEAAVLLVMAASLLALSKKQRR
jgi:desulfoferrodoxin (superoxide reductase-like protein)